MDEHENENFQEILRYYTALIIANPEDYGKKRLRLKLPVIPVPIMKSLLTRALEIFKNEPTILDIQGPVNVIGDIHGHLLDLFRIFKTFRLPPQTKYLFLGDLVDRGEFSVESISLILVMKVLYPDKIYLIRGNHEFAETGERLGFLAEMQYAYNSAGYELFDKFIETFSYMPLAAIINRDIVCVHGGIGPNLTSVRDLESIERPIYEYSKDTVIELLWSDPTSQLPMYLPSNRGYGALFGKMALENFLEKSQAKLVLRGHQCIDAGCESMLSGNLITVFSASHYCGTSRNSSGVVTVNSDGSYSMRAFDPLPYLRRNEVSFVNSGSETQFTMPKAGSLPSVGSDGRLKPGRLSVIAKDKSSTSSRSIRDMPDPLAVVEKRVGNVRCRPVPILGEASKFKRRLTFQAYF